MSRCLTLFGSLALLSTAPLHAQGNLDPPAGGPQASMKTLQQVEPRVDLSNAPANLVATDDPDFYYVIRQPGSYYLSRNAAAGGLVIGGTAKPSVIKIEADDVTLDLNGFRLAGSASTIPGSVAADTAVRVEGSHVTLRNGSISGFETGVDAEGLTNGLTCAALRVSNFTNRGIRLGTGGWVRECVLESEAPRPAYAIRAGATSRIDDCVVRLESALVGIIVSPGSVVSGCVVAGGLDLGVDLVFGGTAKSCEVVLMAKAEGAEQEGFRLGGGGTGSNCSVVIQTLSAGSVAIGFRGGDRGGVVRGCSVSKTRQFGPGGTSSGYSGLSVYDSVAIGLDKGFLATGGSLLTNCTSYETDTGFSLSSSATATGCQANGSSARGEIGFLVSEDARGAVLRNCSASNLILGSGVGFRVEGARAHLVGCHADRNNSNFVVSGNNNRLEDCVAIATATPGGTGFETTGINNTVIRCEAKNCSVNFSLNASTKAGPIVTDPINATNPFSNFSN